MRGNKTVLAKRELVEIADGQSLWNILNAYRLLCLVVRGVLSLIAPVILGNLRVRVGQVFGPGVGQLQVKALAEAAIERDDHCIVRGVSQVLQAAIIANIAVLR